MIDHIWSKYDIDRNGFLDYEEFSSFFAAILMLPFARPLQSKHFWRVLLAALDCLWTAVVPSADNALRLVEREGVAQLMSCFLKCRLDDGDGYRSDAEARYYYNCRGGAGGGMERTHRRFGGWYKEDDPRYSDVWLRPHSPLPTATGRCRRVRETLA